MPMRVLLIDDDPDFRRRFSLMATEAFELTTASTYDEGLTKLKKGAPDAILLDIDLSEARSGIDLLREIRSCDLDLPVIMLTGDDRAESIDAALRAGAEGYTRKHVNLMVLQSLVEHALENAMWRRHARSFQAGTDDLIGHSDTVQNLRREIAEVACTSLRVLIRGESGVGKEIVARAIHLSSDRNKGRFVTVNGAIGTDELFDDVVFGHVRGAFTSADQARVGKLEIARNGTLFLDEIGKMSPARQAKLLRVVEEETFERIGGSDSISTDARMISASNENLEDAVADGRIYQDFFHRMREYEIVVPPLRDRLEDLPEIARFLVDRFCLREGRPAPEMTDDALASLLTYGWPGNVRELDSVMKRAVIRATGTLSSDEIAAALDRVRLDKNQGQDDTLTLDEARTRWEREFVQRAIVRAGGSATRAAEMLGISRSTLYAKLQD